TPAHEDAWHWMGHAFQAQNQLEEALAAYRKQVEVKPDHHDAWKDIGNVFLVQKKYEEAMAMYHKQVEVTPEHNNVWSFMGTALWRQGNRDEAAAAFAKGLTITPNDLSLLSDDAELALVQGDVVRFRTRLDAALPQVTSKDSRFVILPF